MILPDAGKPALPPLRDDLEVVRQRHAGFWTRDEILLYDPARNRYFEFHGLEARILRRWQPDAESLLNTLAADGICTDMPELLSFLQFLQQSELLAARGTSFTSALYRKAGTAPSLINWIIHNYLFLRLHLINPQRHLDRVIPHLGFLFTRAFATTAVTAILLAAYLVVENFALYSSTLINNIGLAAVPAIVLAVVTSKMLHEFGHGIVARHYGVPVTSMGVALIVLWPVLYTETSGAWRLQSHRQRLLINGAGIITELVIAAIATFCWFLSSPGAMQNAFFYLSATSWVMSLAVNLNPFMRFDGYYLFSDFVGISNLQEKSFGAARHYLRRYLGAYDDGYDFQGHFRQRHALAFFGVMTWIYRLVLFLGIAFLVYHFAFKALGIILFLIEIWYFILRPVVAEGKTIFTTMERKQQLRFAAVLGVTLLLTLLPLRQPLFLGAIMQPGRLVDIYPPFPGRIVSFDARSGEIANGELLFTLASDSIDHELEKARLQLTQAEYALKSTQVDGSVSKDRLYQAEVYYEKLSALQAATAKLEQMHIVANFSGVVVDVNPNAATGVYVGTADRLATLVDPTGGIEIKAYLSQADVRKFDPDSTFWFYPSIGGVDRVPLELVRLSDTTLNQLEYPEMSTQFGGSVLTREVDGKFVPVDAVYLAVFRASDPNMSPVLQKVPGTVRATSRNTSILSRLLTPVLAALAGETNL